MRGHSEARRGIGWLATAAALLGAGCDNHPFGPLEDEYVLESIQSDPLPATFLISPGATTVILASTLEFTSATRGEERVRRRIITPADPTGTVTDETIEFSYEVDGNEIEITYDCPDLASCIAGPHLAGELEGRSIVFDHTLGRAPMVYRPD